MALPLPSYSEANPVNAFMSAMQGSNALKSNLYGTQIKKAQAQYAPYTTYADALSKIAYANMAPYQIQATLLSNPMLWLASQQHPEIMQNLVNNFSKSIPSANQINGGGILPPPNSQRSNGLLSLILSKMGIGDSSNSNAMGQGNPSGGMPMGGSPQNAMLPSPDQMQGGSPSGFGAPAPANSSLLLPSANGPMAGYGGKVTAPYTESPFVHGLLPKPGGGSIVAPTSDTVTANQRVIGAANRVTPQLQELADAAQPFQSLTGMGQEKLEELINFVHPSSEYKLPTQHAKFQSLLKSAPESLLKAYGLNVSDETIKRMQDVIEPQRGETGNQYKARILDQINSIYRDQVGESQKQISQGFDLSNQAPASQQAAPAPVSEPTEDDINFTAKKYNMTPAQVKKYLGLK